MNNRNHIWKRLAVTMITGGMVLQIGPCTGDNVREALGSGARSAFNQLFSTVSDSLVTNVFNLP